MIRSSQSQEVNNPKSCLAMSNINTDVAFSSDFRTEDRNPPPSPSKTKSATNRQNKYASFLSATWRNSYDRISHRMVRFWYCDPRLPPLYGPLRFTFYALILYILITAPKGAGAQAFQSRECKRSLARMKHYDIFGFDMKWEAGIFGHGLRYFNIDPRDVFNCDWLSTLVHWSLGLSAIGLGGMIPRIVAATTWWTMFGIKMMSFGKQVGHELYLPGLAMMAFCFAENNLLDLWSIDALLYKLWIKTRRAQAIDSPIKGWDGSSPSPGRAARKLVLVQATCVMFAAGVHKFASYGLTWFDGGTILESLMRQEHRARVPAINNYVVSHSWLFVAPMATVSVLGELSAIGAIFFPRQRHYFVLSWVCFHIGIMVLMLPNFAMNMATYTVLIDWRRLYFKTFVSKMFEVGSQRDKSLDQKILLARGSKHLLSRRKGGLLYSAVALLMFTTAMLRIDWFPFSSYALYNWHTTDNGFHHKGFTPSEAIASANRCLSTPPIGPSCGNKGGSPHQDSFVQVRRDYIAHVIITNVKDDGNGLYEEEEEDEFKCSPYDLNVYRNWKPYGCYPKSMATTPENLQRLLRETASRHLRRTKRQPTESLNWGEFVRKGMNSRIDDAITASLEDAPCFEQNNEGNTTKYNWNADPDPNGAASDMARRLRSGLTMDEFYLPYFSYNNRVLGVGLFFQFIDGGERNDGYIIIEGKTRWCTVGESLVGDFGNLNLSDPSRSRLRQTIINHPRSWSDVVKGIIIATVLSLTAVLMANRTSSKKLRRKHKGPSKRLDIVYDF